MHNWAVGNNKKGGGRQMMNFFILLIFERLTQKFHFNYKQYAASSQTIYQWTEVIPVIKILNNYGRT